MESALLAPMCAYTTWLFGLWMWLGASRGITFLRGTMPMEFLRVGTGALPPDWVVDIHKHFSNQFEIPVVFYLGCLTALAAEAVDETAVTLAWTFVALRVVHSLIVLIRNHPLVRLPFYALSAFAAWALWARLAWRLIEPSA